VKEDSRVVTLRTAETRATEAAQWLAKLDGEQLTSDDRDAFKRWMNADPGNPEAMKKITAFWADMDFLLNEFPTFARKERPSPVRQWKPRRLALAGFSAMLVLTVAAFIGLNLNVKTSEQSFYVTSVGSHREHILSDGSAAHLNTDSMLEIQFSRAQRTVRLLQGEAVFDVAHDANRPFIVLAGANKVVAVGTRFVVKLDSGNVLVAVTDGKVEVSKRKTEKSENAADAASTILLSQGEQAIVDDDHPLPVPQRVEQKEIERKTAWTQGRLVFKNESLEFVLSEIGRYLPEKVIIDDPSLKEVLVSGRFAIGNAEALLEAIEVSLNVKVDRLGSNTIRLARE